VVLTTQSMAVLLNLNSFRRVTHPQNAPPPLVDSTVNNENVNSALDLINSVSALFQHPGSREEEEISHLINAVRWRIQNFHAKRFGYQPELVHE